MDQGWKKQHWIVAGGWLDEGKKMEMKVGRKQQNCCFSGSIPQK
jgi:hypothetical protein